MRIQVKEQDFLIDRKKHSFLTERRNGMINI